jgi:RNA polymerase sigma-70 factor (ECF subfamily)
MVENTDTTTIQQVLSGNPEAFEDLVKKYERQVFSTAYRMTNNAEDAEDITQSVFIKVYENLRSYRPEHKFFSWIYRITVNETMNFLKQRNRIQELDEDKLRENETPEEVYEKAELTDRVQNALLEIPLVYRVVLLLKHFNHFSYREIAYIMDVSEKKVKSRLFTARQHLRTVLLRRGIVPHE